MTSRKHTGELTYIDYLKAAFGWRVAIPALGRVRLNLLCLTGFGLLGLGLPGFWLLGMAYEAAYLLLMSGSRRFQSVVRGTFALHEQEVWRHRQRSLLESLDSESRYRYDHLLQTSNQIVGNAGADGASTDQLQARGLGRLLWMFLQLLVSRARIRTTLTGVSVAHVQHEIEQLTSRIQGLGEEDSPLRRSLQGSLDIARRRHDNLVEADNNLALVEAELDRVEQQFTLLLEQSSVSTSPASLTARLDGMLQSAEDTSRWLAEHAEVLGVREETDAPLLSCAPTSEIEKE
jgi:hypothetical protein